jgi:hypothetical protein
MDTISARIAIAARSWTWLKVVTSGAVGTYEVNSSKLQ